MKKTRKIMIVLALVVAFSFTVMATNYNLVLADDAVEKDILKKVKRIKSILNNQVLPKLDVCFACPESSAGVPKTGQTVTYATGDDGDLQKGTSWPNPRFTDNGDGTVTDNLTGLIWLKNANCFGDRTWADALTDSGGLADGSCALTDGSSAGDWHLPNVRELHSLISYGWEDSCHIEQGRGWSCGGRRPLFQRFCFLLDEHVNGW
jgi:hypothetical protein